MSYDAATRKLAVDWLRDSAADARQDDPSVGIFRNEELASLFDALALDVECGDWVPVRMVVAGFMTVNEARASILNSGEFVLPSMRKKCAYCTLLAAKNDAIRCDGCGAPLP